MAAYMDKLILRTTHNGFHEITESVQKIITKSKIESGFALLHCNHTTAAITTAPLGVYKVYLDIMEALDRIVPARNDFLHKGDTPTDASGHIKSVLLGCTLTIIVEEGKALIGQTQGIFLVEFDGPRERQVLVKIVSDK